MHRVRPFPIFFTSTLIIALTTSTVHSRPDEKAPLGGPAVKDRAVPGTSNSFSESMTPDQSKRTPRIAPRVFFEAVRSLTDESTPVDLQPSEEQRETVRSLITEFQDSARDFREENAEAIKELQAKAGLPGGPEGRGPRQGQGKGRNQPGSENAPPPPPPGEGRQRRGGPNATPPTPEQQAAREELRALMAKGPKPDDTYTRIWEVLTEPQREFVQARLESHQQERMTRAEGRNNRQAAKPGAGSGDDASLKEYEGLTPEELREKMRSLPREEREAIRQKLRNLRSGSAPAEQPAKPD